MDLQFVHSYHYGYIHSSELMHYLQEYIDSNDKRFSHCSCSLYPIFTYLYHFRLPPSSESRLQLLYKRNVRTSTDPYKKAVYCLLARCDINDNHSHVLIKTEDYMWLKVRRVSFLRGLHFHGFQGLFCSMKFNHNPEGKYHPTPNFVHIRVHVLKMAPDFKSVAACRLRNLYNISY